MHSENVTLDDDEEEEEEFMVKFGMGWNEKEGVAILVECCRAGERRMKGIRFAGSEQNNLLTFFFLPRITSLVQ